MDDFIKYILAFKGLRKYILSVAPSPKPRMVNSDKYKKRSVVLKYWAFKDSIRLAALSVKLMRLPRRIPLLIFYVPIPKSKAKKLKENDPVEVRPDVDNYIKALLDCMESEDNYIFYLGAAKLYSSNPRIEIYLLE